MGSSIITTGEMVLPVPSATHWLPLGEGRLHVRRFGDPSADPVLLIHGAIEDGRIFYSHNGKGLAPFIARNGFDVFVPDFRGHGRSEPQISRTTRFGQTEMITEELPAILDAMEDWTGGRPVHLIAHSWGGVIVSSCLARFPERMYGVRSLLYLGTKRCIRVKNWCKRMQLDLMWNGLGRILTAIFGYLPARLFHLGATDETKRYHRQTLDWIRPGPWIDPYDRFNYAAAAQATRFPPTWFVAGAGDACLGHPDDVWAFMGEHGDQPLKFSILGKEEGHFHDYGHVDMLTHPDAPEDHFPLLVEWLKNDHEAVRLGYQ